MMNKVLAKSSGWLIILGLTLTIVSGVVLLFYYAPASMAGAYASVVEHSVDSVLYRFCRALHFWSTHFMLVLTLVHWLLILSNNTSTAEEMTSWPSGLLGFLVLTALAFSGRLLIGDDHAGVSLFIAEKFLRVGQLNLMSLTLGGENTKLLRLLVIHGGLAVGLGLLLGRHIPWRTKLTTWLDGPLSRRAAITMFFAVFVLIAWSFFICAPLGPVFIDAETVRGTCHAEWYLRWLQRLAEQSLLLAKLVVLALVVTCACANWLSKKLPLKGMRILGALLLGMLVVLSV